MIVSTMNHLPCLPRFHKRVLFFSEMSVNITAARIQLWCHLSFLLACPPGPLLLPPPELRRETVPVLIIN